MDGVRLTSTTARLADIAVLLLAATLAVLLFTQSLPASDELWRDVFHDRNGHYTFGLKLALFARDLDLGAFIGELEKAKVWPPVHGLVLSFVLLAGGIDHHLGVVPSLIGWAMTIFFTWKIAVRSLEEGVSGVVAGMAGVALVATSPALALISTDVMLEGLGSGLSALCLWLFMVALSDDGRPRHWRSLAIALTVLFFEKYNYWAIVAVSLALTALLIGPRARDFAQHASRMLPAALGMLLRNPWFVCGAVVILAAVAINARGPTSVGMFGYEVSLYPPRNIVTAGYALLFVAAVLVWKKHRTDIAAFVGVPGSMLLSWHVAPIAVSFLLPQRLATFVWFLGPSNSLSTTRFDPLGAAATYGQAVLDGFVSHPAIGLGVLALFAAAVFLMRTIRAQACVVFVFAAVSALALVVHPQHQPRFLTTSIFALFCGAGIGLAVLLRLLVPSVPAARLAAGAAIASAVLAAQLALPYPDSAYDTAIRTRHGTSNLALVRLYQPLVTPAQPLAIGATFGSSTLLYWPILEACKCVPRIDLPEFDLSADRAVLAASGKRWLEQTEAKQAVIVDVPSYVGQFIRYEDTAGIVDAARLQTRFRVEREIESRDPAGRILFLTRP